MHGSWLRGVSALLVAAMLLISAAVSASEKVDSKAGGDGVVQRENADLDRMAQKLDDLISDVEAVYQRALVELQAELTRLQKAYAEAVESGEIPARLREEIRMLVEAYNELQVRIEEAYGQWLAEGRETVRNLLDMAIDQLDAVRSAIDEPSV